MDRPKLFLICPDCHLENSIKSHFTGNLFFLTALGSVFDIYESDYAESIHHLLINEKIKEIIIINDCSCRFIQSVLNNERGYETGAEEVLQVLHTNCQIEILAEKYLSRQAFKLAELNIKQQALCLRETSFLGSKLEKSTIGLKGLIYERDKNIFSEIKLE